MADFPARETHVCSATTNTSFSADTQTESAAFLAYFDALVDPRQPGKVIYPLNDVLLLSLLATLAGAETFVDIALFGVKKRELPRRFLTFAKGTPSHDHLGDLFATLDQWVASATLPKRF